MGNTEAKTQAERFAEIRSTYPTKEEFRASIEAENVKTLRASAEEFEINLEGRDKKADILDTIVDSVYADEGADNANAPAGGVEGAGEGEGGDQADNTNDEIGDKPTPAHDEATKEGAQAGADLVDEGNDPAPSAGANKLAMDSTTESAEAVPGADKGDVIATSSPANPNERWTEPNEMKKKRLAEEAAQKESGE